MVYRTRIYYTAAQKAEMWDRWQRGESLNSMIQGILAVTGGMRPHERRRSHRVLTLVVYPLQ